MDNLDGKKNQFMNQGNAMAEFWKNEDNENEQGQKSPNTWNLKPNNQLN